MRTSQEERVREVVACALVGAAAASGGCGDAGPGGGAAGPGPPGGFAPRLDRVEVGAPVEDRASTGGVSWIDHDGDGDLDLFVTNGYDVTAEVAVPQANRLYENVGGGRLRPVETGPLVRDSRFSSGSAWADYDNDGDLDLYVVSQGGAANRLYRNEGEAGFRRVEDDPAVLDGGHTSGATWGDADNDGDLDLAVTNWDAATVLYVNDGRGRFRRASAGDLGGTREHPGNLAWGDFDGDGALDLYLGNWPNWPGEGEENELYRNRAEVGNWLVVRLAGTRSNRSGIGARVIVRAEIHGRTVQQLQELGTQTSFRSQEGLRLHFGLGDAPAVEEMVVRWPSGAVRRLSDVAVNRVVTVTEGGG